MDSYLGYVELDSFSYSPCQKIFREESQDFNIFLVLEW